MSTTTTRLSLLKPDPTEVANYLTAINNNLDTLDAFQSFQGVTSFPGGPITGKSVQISGSHVAQPYFYNGTGWKTLQRRLGAQQAFNNTSNTTASTSFVAPTNNISVTYTAPENGAVRVTVGGHSTNSGAGSGFLGFEVRETNVSGALIVAAADRKAVSQQDTDQANCSLTVTLTGLTPWQVYFFRCMIRASSGTMTNDRRKLLVESC